MAAKSVKIPKGPVRMDTSILYRLVEYSPGCYGIEPVPGQWETRRTNLPELKHWKMNARIPWPPITCEQVYVPKL